MASESSFDIVSKVDKQEVANALHQAQKEVSQRYDFRNVGAEIDFSGEKILIKANTGTGSSRRLPVEARQARYLAQVFGRWQALCFG